MEKKEEMGLTKTFLPMTLSFNPLGIAKDGFTLIEALIVIAIIAIIAVVALPSVTGYFKISINTTAREMASTIKETYNSTSLTGKVHRMAYDLKENSYWVESGSNTVLLDTAESKEKEERRKRFAKSSDTPPPSQFSMDNTITHKKISLPTGVTFEDIITEQSKDPIKEGIVYTHFFPHGITEQTIIHLKDNSEHKVSLVLAPIIGKTDLYERYLNLTDLKNEL